MYYVPSNKLFTPNDTILNPTFMVFKHPLVASLIYPSVENNTEFKIYEAHGTPKQDRGYYCHFDEIQIIQECIFTRPEADQYNIFAILCSLCTNDNQIFKNWAFDYLLGKDRTGETAFEIHKKILESMHENPNDLISSCFPTLSCVMLNQPLFFAGSAAHRAYHDCIDQKNPLDLEKLALISTQLKPEEICKLISK